MPAKIPSKLSLNCSSDSDVPDSKDIMTESGYASATSSDDELPDIMFTKPHLQFLNRQLQFLEPQGSWAFYNVARCCG